MTHIAKLGLAALRLAIQAAVGIALAGVRFIAAPLVVEIRAVAFFRTVLWLEALERSPRLNQRAIDRKMLIRQQRLHARMIQQGLHEPLEHIAILQPLPVLGECGGNPNRRIRRQADKPAKQQIIIQLLHQLAFRPQAVKRLEQ